MTAGPRATRKPPARGGGPEGGATVGRQACRACLRRGALVGRLAPKIAGLLDGRGRRPPRLLELGDDELVAALAGPDAEGLPRWLECFDVERARGELGRAGVDCVCRHSRSFPPALLDLSDPPAALYVGDSADRLTTLAAEPVVTVVGGRRATPYALQVAASLGRGLAAAGVTVVSGLALGVDAAAQRGAMGAGDRTIAVLASGADVPYPRSHLGLYREIRARAAVVSELPPGTQPMRWSFPARNRLMAALGGMVIVVEAEEGSGSLITAAFAGDLGREVGAVPGRVTTSKAAGSNRLLRDGARLIRGPEDVLDELFGVGAAGSLGTDSGGGRRPPRARAPKGGRPAPERDLDAPSRRVLEAVEAGHRVDAIGREAGLPPGEVRAALGRLELLGLVARDGLGLYERTAG